MNKLQITHPAERYENIFNMYEDANSNGDSYVFYNIINKVTISDDVDPNVFEYYTVPSQLPLTTISYRIYENISLWWLIMLTNNIKNPVKLLAPGSVIRVIKPEFLSSVLISLQQK
jgi:hypothetical protein